MVLGTVPDFTDFHIHLPTFLWQLRCFVEWIIRKRLSDSFIHNSAIVRLSANSSSVSHHDQRLCQTLLLQFYLLLGSLSKLTRRQPTCKFPFRRTQGQVNSVGPWHPSLWIWMEICLLTAAASVCLSSLLKWVSAATDPETYQWCSGLDSIVDFGKQNCNISLSQKPIIWFPELLSKFISGFKRGIFQDIKASNFIRSINCSIMLLWISNSYQVIPGDLQKYVSTNRSLLQCKTLLAHFSNNIMVYCLLNVI